MADTTKESDQRARLVSVLWELKQEIKHHDASETEGIHFVHFNTLLKDDHYRQQILEKAQQSQVEQIRILADQATKLNMSGSLVGYADQIDGADDTGEAPIPKAKKSHWPLYLGGAVISAGLVVGLVSAKLPWLEQSERVEVTGSIYDQVLWKSNNQYYLNGLVFVESGSTLTIEKGTKIYGNPGSALIVTRDGSLNARGTREAPIVFTSSKQVGQRTRGDWGGIVLLGNAPVNTGTGRIEGVSEEDPRGIFGGDDANSSCGLLQYVRIEFAGYEISADNELNGLTLGGCGSGTVLRYVQVHMGLDDGIEFFGGTANLRNIVISRAGDDGLDWDRGWTGKGQFIIIHQSAEDGDNGIEADNYKKDNEAQPRSAPTLSNVTIVNSHNKDASQRGMTLRRGTGGDLRNFLITGSSKEMIDIRDVSTAQLTESGGLKFDSILFLDPATRGQFFESEVGEADDDGGFDENSFFSTRAANTEFSDKQLLSREAYDPVNPDFTPPAKSIAEENSAPIPQGEFWDEAANYRGAIRPGNRATWLDGWTAFPES